MAGRVYQGTAPGNWPNVWARAGVQNEPGLARPTARRRRCSHGCSTSQAHSPLAGPQGVESASDQEKTTQQGNWGQEVDVPILEVGTGQDDTRVPHPNNQAATSHPPLAPHNHILKNEQLSCSLNYLSYTQGHANLGAGCRAR